MGVAGLLRLLLPISRRCHLSKFRGQTAVVDACGWLHRAAYSCARDLVTGTPTLKYLQFCLKLLQLMAACEVTPILVFDGAQMPLKADTNEDRRKHRETARQAAEAALAKGDENAAKEHFRRAVRIQDGMVQALIELCRANSIQFVVAPYEADSQMAFMIRRGLADFAVTEDSDLLLFGAAIFTKLTDNGDGVVVDLKDLKDFTVPEDLVEAERTVQSGACLGDQPKCFQTMPKRKGQTEKQRVCVALKDAKIVRKLANFSHDQFVEMCVLAGCDYLKALPNIGLKRAFQLMNEWRRGDRALKCLPPKRVPKGYLADFQRAVLAFKHQRVFDTTTNQLTTLQPLTEEARRVGRRFGDEQLNFLGPEFPEAEGVAKGEINVFSKQPVTPLSEDQRKQIAALAVRSQRAGFTAVGGSVVTAATPVVMPPSSHAAVRTVSPVPFTAPSPSPVTFPSVVRRTVKCKRKRLDLTAPAVEPLQLAEPDCDLTEFADLYRRSEGEPSEGEQSLWSDEEETGGAPAVRDARATPRKVKVKETVQVGKKRKLKRKKNKAKKKTRFSAGQKAIFGFLQDATNG